VLIYSPVPLAGYWEVHRRPIRIAPALEELAQRADESIVR